MDPARDRGGELRLGGAGALFDVHGDLLICQWAMIVEQFQLQPLDQHRIKISLRAAVVNSSTSPPLDALRLTPYR
jgi:hypothetical protein